MARKEMTMEKELQLFIGNLNNEIPKIKERFRWVRGQEREINADNSYLWKNTFYYNLVARNCYCCGFYFAAIQMITSSIEVAFLQIFREYFPNSISKRQEKSMNLESYIELAYSKKIIGKELKNKLNKFRKIIRNPVTHPKPYMPLTLGFKEIETGSWKSINGQKMIEPKEAAEDGLMCMFQLSREFDDWKLNHSRADNARPT